MEFVQSYESEIDLVEKLNQIDVEMAVEFSILSESSNRAAEVRVNNMAEIDEIDSKIYNLNTPHNRQRVVIYKADQSGRMAPPVSYLESSFPGDIRQLETRRAELINQIDLAQRALTKSSVKYKDLGADYIDVKARLDFAQAQSNLAAATEATITSTMYGGQTIFERVISAIERIVKMLVLEK